jgi:tRNA modification GTPase
MSVYIDDTIAGISTAPGEGAIGIVRMSGRDSIEIADRIIKSKKGRLIKDMKTYTMMYGYVVDPKNKESVDEVVVSLMRSPGTYTREDIVEINCHGGMMAVRRILSLVLENGARLAEPGEFTKRAFLNGRIDLSQAEGVMDLIRSKTETSMKVALSQTQGKLSVRVRQLMEKLLKILSHIGAAVDFPEEDVEDVVIPDILKISREINKEIHDMIDSSDAGKIIREGLNVTIVGKPNVGKSSLLNALIEENRAIVTDIPGTTRDTIEEYINIQGIPVRLIDTAGIRLSEDVVEKIGIKKSIEYMEKSDLIILIFDSSRPIDDEDRDIIDKVRDKKVIIIVNKSDLPCKMDMDEAGRIAGRFPIIHTSINGNKGIEEIKTAIAKTVYKGEINLGEVYVTNVRHKELLRKAEESINSGIETLNNGYPIDFASIDFKDAYLRLGEITGDTVEDDIIDRIFKDFCVGK